MTINLTQIAIGVETLTCECGLAFAVPQAWVDARRSDHATWYCPNGHKRYFPGKSREEQLREELDREQRKRADVESSRDYWRTEQEQTARRLVATRGVVTRTKKRIADGKCPCCKASFKDLATHMASEHPTYAEPAP